MFLRNFCFISFASCYLDHSKELKISTTIKDSFDDISLSSIVSFMEQNITTIWVFFSLIIHRSLRKWRNLQDLMNLQRSFFLFGRRGFESSPPCKSPESSPSPSLDHFSFWTNSNSIDFTLIKTPWSAHLGLCFHLERSSNGWYCDWYDSRLYRF